MNQNTINIKIKFDLSKTMPNDNIVEKDLKQVNITKRRKNADSASFIKESSPRNSNFNKITTSAKVKKYESISLSTKRITEEKI